MKKQLEITGDIPYVYKRETIWIICTAINNLVKCVNQLIDAVNKLERERDASK
jgi:hypothetical protein